MKKGRLACFLAGVAAALCARKNCAPDELDGSEVRRLLAAAGARL